ncbi:hypothetical protein BDV28DRAFT_160385 [Aspergillus coremiiformis]|uniref:Uncharacterized protein n=1 Tax=Aspergillus coremiiformis TaxID=138285 RepID=A0A5N6YWQ5_9EURO|nr:hypothetical protein BDV28DRAFT_160385 [Aspergillus coremiiformis]
MQATRKRLIQYVGGVALSDIKNIMHRDAARALCEKVEQEDSRVKKAQIKGSQPHKSYDDPDDPKDVISIRFLSENDTRLGTAHVHEDGSFKMTWKKWK